MNKLLTIHPSNSEALEVGDKVTTIILEGIQLVIGGPCYGLEDKYANTLLTYQPYRQLSPATESSNFRSSNNAEYDLS